MGKLLTIEEMQDIAAEHDGKCLSIEYINSNTKLKWQCKEGHVWESTPLSVKYAGNWCSLCSRKKLLTIEEMQDIAAEHGGKCLSEKYINSKTNLKLHCIKGHIWETAPNNVRQGNWCPICAGTKLLTIEEMQGIANERGGKCLSPRYINSTTNLKWQCKEGHIWEAKPYLVKQGTWCPKCRIWIGENTCRLYMENIFSNSFPKSKPKWLKNDKGNQLELDGYCEKLKLAFEYQGIQHYKSDGWFSKEKVEKVKWRDEQKRKICNQNGVSLLIIPYQNNLDVIYDTIIDQCRKYNFIIPNYDKNLKFENFTSYSYNNLEELRKIALRRGGELLSQTYFNNKTPLLWQCKDGHVWKATPNSVRKGYDNSRKGTWCAICSGKKQHTIEEMQKLAVKHGGLCLSNEYLNSKTKLKWQCKVGHVWETAPGNIFQGYWCPVCRRIEINKNMPRLTIEEMQRIAAERGGRCLSYKYINSKTMLKWQCKFGHEWEAVPGLVKHGTWCLACSGRQRLTIEEMQRIAAERGGRCLSEVYKNAMTKLKWQCKEGHIWMAIPASINRGHWCPLCGGSRILLDLSP
ncbi:MAG: hypothetical protein RLZZ455_245 [Candidatus Parcubacteria bacterium]|jgi:thiol-disulfide isomerase/thioredoxin